MMKKSPPPESADAYVAALDGWRRRCVDTLREAVRRVPGLEEGIKWGHLVYSSNGPVLLIRAEEERVLFGFWRGKLLREIEPRLKPGGKYEMATLELGPDTIIDAKSAERLARQAVTLNERLGNPQDAAPKRKTVAKEPALRATKSRGHPSKVK